MDFCYHLMNRLDAVAIFVDMDPSILLTDCALPFPLGTSTNDSKNGSNSSAHESGRNSRVCASPCTRYEVLRTALRAFVLQKQRASPDAAKYLRFALYAVWDDVTELLPLTSGDAGAMEIALRKCLPPTVDLSSRAPLGPFPFRDVAGTLRRIEANVASAGGAGLTQVQGIVLLSRDSETPNSTLPLEDMNTPVANSSGRHVWRYLDILPLGAMRRQSSADCVDCPCHVVEPTALTGVAHRGLAVGCALAKLVAPYKQSLCHSQSHSQSQSQSQAQAQAQGRGALGAASHAAHRVTLPVRPSARPHAQPRAALAVAQQLPAALPRAAEPAGPALSGVVVTASDRSAPPCVPRAVVRGVVSSESRALVSTSQLQRSELDVPVQHRRPSGAPVRPAMALAEPQRSFSNIAGDAGARGSKRVSGGVVEPPQRRSSGRAPSGDAS